MDLEIEIKEINKKEVEIKINLSKCKEGNELMQDENREKRKHESRSVLSRLFITLNRRTFVVQILMFTPFIICDLITTYSSDECMSQKNFLTLRNWLGVSGFTELGFLVCCGIFLILSRKREDKYIFLMYTLHFLRIIFGLFWMIMGGILFWRDVVGCEKITKDYVNTRLIISYIIYGFSLFLFKGIKND